MSVTPISNQIATIQVAKFGGTSMADADAIRACVAIICAEKAPTLVVVSACAGITNRLIAISESRTLVERQRLADEIIQRHQHIAEQAHVDTRCSEALQQLHQQLIDIIVAPCPTSTVALLRRRDLILSFGERCSSELFAAIWRQYNASATCIDARDYLSTDGRHGQASPDWVAMQQACLPLQQRLQAGDAMVTQGFIGSGPEGYTTTLGRGGSDYSAALFAAAMQTQRLNIWTDVAGIYTTDPRVCEDARPLAEISFAEAAELATFGAKVLHPKSLKPAIEHGIDVFVGHSRKPEQGGTLISATPVERPSIRALALRRNQTLLTVHSVDMLHATGFLARLFDVLARYDVSVDLVTTSEVSIAITLDEEGSKANGDTVLAEAMLTELQQFAHVNIESGLTLIAVIGNDIGHFGDISPSVLQAASPATIRMVCQGASHHNLCFLVDDKAADTVVKKLHAKL
ncbi:MAG: lysine-sensitive aspartokinase 3 [Idiomarinaceae bacterium]|nr:lysine-sensitive aspartokinase 3 [Idiomarinaceae bacterium]